MKKSNIIPRTGTAMITTTSPLLAILMNGSGGRLIVAQDTGGGVAVTVEHGSNHAKVILCRTAWEALRGELWRLERYDTPDTTDTQEATDHE